MQGVRDEVNISQNFDPFDLVVKLRDENAKPVQDFFRIPDLDSDQKPAPKAFRIKRVNEFLTELETAVTGNPDVIAEYNEEQIKQFIAILKDNNGRNPDYSDKEHSRVRFESKVPPGVSGLNALAILQLFEIAIADKTVCIDLSGNIRDYIFDENAESGHLSVDVMISFFNSYEAFRASEPDQTIVFHWDVEVFSPNFKVHKRCGDPIHKPDDPYPGTVDFPPSAIDPKNKGSVWYRGLDYKIFARGDENVIKVHHVYMQVDNEPIHRLPDEHPVYQSDPDSCVDLMFNGPPPARVLPVQKSYCLGRCKTPAILNTSGI